MDSLPKVEVDRISFFPKVEVDRFSFLPDCILESVVSLLPIREAGRTSILSRRWRYVWASAPSLNIMDDNDHINSFTSFTKFVMDVIDDTKHVNLSTDLNWSVIAEQALSLHNGTILDFRLYTRAGQCDLDRWIPLLTKKGLQKLSMNYRDDVQGGVYCMSYRMHSSLFSCSSLVSLELGFCSLEVEPSCDYKGIPSLKILTLARVRLNDSILESLVSGSGRLEILALVQCDGLSHIKIHGPKLLSIYLISKFSDINLSKCSNLKLLLLSGASMSCKFLEGLLRLEVLYFHGSSTLYFSGGDVVGRLSTTYKHIRILVLSLNTRNIMEVSDVQSQSQSQSQIQIQSEGCFWENMNNGQSGSWLSCLRRVNIWLGEIRLEDMKLIKFLLLNTKVLDEFFIGTRKGMDQAKQLSLENQLLLLPKASSRAMIVFKNLSRYGIN
ncbi:hypothetical protein AMTR_s00040p00098000 [Amborella trichopoda]|uniref:FBD domain-containing protein n=1 Tax=Amborella trichopoda TaxID=13333 RepID=W1PSK4_AMBTC|nr:hypothetical protein AMTR_s00040p00098000 [Amborella trichopoda]